MRVERHPTGIVRPENNGLLVARMAGVVGEMRSDEPHFVDTPEREGLAERLVLDDPRGMGIGTWVVAGRHAGRLAAGYLTGTPVSGSDAVDQVPGWASAFWWGLIARDTETLVALAGYPVDRLRGFDCTGVFDEFQFEWLEVLQSAWLHGPEAVADRVNELRTVGRVGTQEYLNLLLHPVIEVFARFCAGDEAGFDRALVTALYRHREFFDTDRWRQELDGVISAPLLGLACWARDRGLDIQVESDYLPSGFLERPDWARSAEVAAAERAGAAATERALRPSLRDQAYQRIGAVLAATAPADRGSAGVTATRNGHKLLLAPRFRPNDGESQPFTPPPDAVRELAAGLSRLYADTRAAGEQWPRKWRCELSDDTWTVWHDRLSQRSSLRNTRFVPSHVGKMEAPSRTACSDHSTAADLQCPGTTTFPSHPAEADTVEKAYAQAGFATLSDAHGRTAAMRDAIRMAAAAAAARLEANRTLAQGHPGTPPIGEFFDALWPAVIARDRRLTDLLLGTRAHTGFPLGAAGDDPGIRWAEAWKSVWAEGFRAQPEVEIALAVAEAGDDHARLIVAPALRVLHAALFTYGSFYGEQHVLDSAMAEALEQHRTYWSTPERRDDPRGFIAWPLLAVACQASDRYRALAVASGYLPATLIPAEWTRWYQQT